MSKLKRWILISVVLLILGLVYIYGRSFDSFFEAPVPFHIVSTLQCFHLDHLPKFQNSKYGRHMVLEFRAGRMGKGCELSMTDTPPIVQEHLIEYLQLEPSMEGKWEMTMGGVVFRHEKTSKGFEFNKDYVVRLEQELHFRATSNYQPENFVLEPFEVKFRLPPVRVWIERMAQTVPNPNSGTYTGKFRIRSNYELSESGLPSETSLDGPRATDIKFDKDNLEIDGLNPNDKWTLNLLSAKIFRESIPFKTSALTLPLLTADEFEQHRKAALAEVFKSQVRLKFCKPDTAAEDHGAWCTGDEDGEKAIEQFELKWKEQNKRGYRFKAQLNGYKGTFIVRVDNQGQIKLVNGKKPNSKTPPVMSIEDILKTMRAIAFDPMGPGTALLLLDMEKQMPYMAELSRVSDPEPQILTLSGFVFN